MTLSKKNTFKASFRNLDRSELRLDNSSVESDVVDDIELVLDSVVTKLSCEAGLCVLVSLLDFVFLFLFLLSAQLDTPL